MKATNSRSSYGLHLSPDQVSLATYRLYSSNSAATASFGITYSNRLLEKRPQAAESKRTRDALLISPNWFMVYFASTIGICEASWSWIMRSMRWSIWQNSAVFFAEMTFSKIGTYFMRSATTFCSLAASRLI